MKRLFFLSMSMLMLTVLLFYRPQPNADGQPSTIAQRDTMRRKLILPDSIDLSKELDSNRRILNEIQGSVQGIKKGVNELVKDRRSSERRSAVKSKDTCETCPPAVAHAPDTVLRFNERIVSVPVVDSTMAGKTWFGQLFVHIGRCRADRLFKPRQWGKGKF